MNTKQFTVTTEPATGTGDIAGFAATCDGCGYVISYSIRTMVIHDMTGHLATYCATAQVADTTSCTTTQAAEARCGCPRITVDCCTPQRVECRTDMAYDADGTPLVRHCITGHGCNTRGSSVHVKRSCGACECVA